MAGLLAAGSGVVAPVNDASATSASSAVHRNTIACQYILYTYSGMLQPKGFQPADLPKKVAAAASATLRKEMRYSRSAAAYKNYAGVVEAGTAMVNTCDNLGLSNVDR